MQTGWGVLELETRGDTPDGTVPLVIQGYAAGFLEGFATAHRTKDQVQNLSDIAFGEITDHTWKFVNDQLQWQKEQLGKEENAKDEVWKSVRILIFWL